MAAVLSSNNYGKSDIRVLKVTRKDKLHEIREFAVNVQLKGDFDAVHLEGDNSKVLPTDTMKNTVYALAKDNFGNSIEDFAIYLAEYFKENNSQVTKVMIGIEERLWERISSPGENKKALSHDHSFVNSGNERRTVSVSLSEDGLKLTSGLMDLLVLKTTGSGFENYIRDKYTTLPATPDRIFSTSIKAVWNYANQEVNYLKMSENVREVLLKVFANQHSLSVQQTLYEMGREVIDSIEDITEISLSMPNKHYLLFNLNQFDMENKNEIFIPTSEPFGLIEGTVSRKV